MVRRSEADGADERRDYTRGPHLYRRGRTWWAYLGDGQRVSLGTTDEAEARAELGRRLTERPAQAPRVAGTPLPALAEAWLTAPHGWTARTAHSYKLRALCFVQDMLERGAVVAEQVTSDVLDAWRTARMEGTSRATINRDEAAVRGMFAWAVEAKRLKSSPFEGRKLLREPKRSDPKLLPRPADVLRVVALCPKLGEASAKLRRTPEGATEERSAWEGVALVLRVLLATGLRIDELRHLREAWLTAEGVRVLPEEGAASDAWTTKSYRKRLIPCGEEGLTAARDFLEWRASARGRRGHKGELVFGSAWWRKTVERAATRANVKRFLPHDLRRVFATECVRAGVPISSVRDWLGHRDVQTTERYVGRYHDDPVDAGGVPSSLYNRVYKAGGKGLGKVAKAGGTQQRVKEKNP